MRESDFDHFSALLDDVAGLYPRGAISAGQKAMFFRALSSHSLSDVRAGFDAHVKDTTRGRFLPMPADILAQIEGLAADDGRPGPEEAWATALRCSDEENTVVWTDEMSQAWSITSPVFSNGDEIGARMAFKESYVRLVDEARRARRAANWTASLGFNLERRTEALRIGHASGRLIGGPDLVALPAPIQSVAELSAVAPEHIRERLLDLRERLTSRKGDVSEADAAREATNKLKAEAAEQVAAYRGNEA